jgi:thioredoxin-like negative regulator of GroEL
VAADPVLLVVQLEPANRGGQGDSIYRTVQPCRALGELPGVAVVSGSWLDRRARELAVSADALVLVMTAEPDLVPLLLERRRRGLFTVAEVNDDALSPQAWNPTANVARDPFLRASFLRLVALADALQLSVAPLSDRYGHLAARREVLVNHLWQLPPLPARPRPPGSPVRVGWGGSLGHRDDLSAHLPAVRAALERHPGAVLSVMGPESFRPLLSGFPAGRAEFRPAGSLEAYYGFLASLDVGLCPLLDSDWNRCRSDVKWLEYAAHGVAPLVARLDPYAGVVDGRSGLGFGSPGELSARLSQVLADPSLRARIGAGARAAAERRVERDHAPDRLAFWRRAAAEAGRALQPRRHPELEPAFLETGPFPGSRYHPAPEAGNARLLHDGLVLLRDGHAAEARRHFAEAAAADAGDFLPTLYLGSAEEGHPAALRALRRATELAPGSPTAARALATRLLAAGETETARAELVRGAGLSPALGICDALLAELELDGGRAADGLARLRGAVAANPFLAPAVARLAREEAAAGRTAEAEALLRAAIAGDGRAWQTRLALGRLLLEAGRPADARLHLEIAAERADDPVPALVQLARAAAAQGRIDEARELLAEIRRRGGGAG